MDNPICALFESPIGKILAVKNTSGFTRINFLNDCTKFTLKIDSQIKKNEFEDLFDQLNGYFSGSLRTFNLSLSAEGTPFQLNVWKALNSISYGSTISYNELAQKIGKPRGARAVGAANRVNPFPVIIPCHRVIGSNGKLTGYSAGLNIKKALLDHERKNLVTKTPMEQPKFSYI